MQGENYVKYYVINTGEEVARLCHAVEEHLICHKVFNPTDGDFIWQQYGGV